METLKNPQCCVAPSSHSLTQGWPRPPLQQTRRYATNLERMIYLSKQLKMAVIQSDETVAQSDEMVCYFDDGTREFQCYSDEWNIDRMRLHVITQGATFVSALSAPTGRILEYYVNDKPKVQSISMSELTETDSPYWRPQTKSNGPK